MIVVNRTKTAIALLIALIFIPMVGINLSQLDQNVQSNSAINTPAESDNLDNALKSLVKSSDQTNFFAEYRMERERVRGKETGLLREIANNVASDKKARDIAALKLVELAEEAEKEMQAEAMIKSQGFQDCAVIITPNGITVMVESNSMQIEGQEQIKRAVSMATGYTEKNISIVKRQHTGP